MQVLRSEEIYLAKSLAFLFVSMNGEGEEKMILVVAVAVAVAVVVMVVVGWWGKWVQGVERAELCPGPCRIYCFEPESHVAQAGLGLTG